jgi:peptidoglycan hydrolase-like protein with peptidoglycan-binding domain
LAEKKEYRVNDMEGGFNHLIIALLDSFGSPRSDTSYTLKVGDVTYEGRTDSKGNLDQRIPRKYKEATLIIDEQEVKIKIEDISSLEELEVVQQLLNNLGFDCGSPLGTMNEETQEALREFQELFELEVTGEVTEETKNKLKEFFETEA